MANMVNSGTNSNTKVPRILKHFQLKILTLQLKFLIAKDGVQSCPGIFGHNKPNCTVKSDTLKLVDISMSNCTSSWQLLALSQIYPQVEYQT